MVLTLNQVRVPGGFPPVEKQMRRTLVPERRGTPSGGVSSQIFWGGSIVSESTRDFLVKCFHSSPFDFASYSCTEWIACLSKELKPLVGTCKNLCKNRFSSTQNMKILAWKIAVILCQELYVWSAVFAYFLIQSCKPNWPVQNCHTRVLIRSKIP